MILKRMNVEIETTDAAEISRLKAEGFELYGVEQTEAVSEEQTDLEAMTVKELRALADERGIKLSHALRKQDIIEMLEDTNDSGTENSTADKA